MRTGPTSSTVPDHATSTVEPPTTADAGDDTAGTGRHRRHGGQGLSGRFLTPLVGWVDVLVPDGVDVTRPSPARVWDALRGGLLNFAADRAVSDTLRAADPTLPWWAGAHHDFLRRAVAYATGRGVRQFLDLGCGLPTFGGLPRLLDTTAAQTRLVCVDIDPVVTAYLTHQLADRPHTTVLCADVRDVDTILDHPDTNRVLDLTQPVAVGFTAVAHYLPDHTHLAGTLDILHAALPPGSHLLMSHPTPPAPGSAALHAVIDHYQATTATWTLRDAVDAPALLGPWTPTGPGITGVDAWHPQPHRHDAEAGPVPLWHPGWAVVAAHHPHPPPDRDHPASRRAPPDEQPDPGRSRQPPHPLAMTGTDRRDHRPAGPRLTHRPGPARTNTPPDSPARHPFEQEQTPACPNICVSIAGRCRHRCTATHTRPAAGRSP